MYYHEIGESVDQSRNHRSKYVKRLRDHLSKKLSKKENKAYTEIEIPLVRVLAKMEHLGIKIEIKVIEDLDELATEQIAKLEKKIHKLAGTDFNISSPQQLGEILFNKLNLKGKVRKTGGGAPSTAASELEKLRDEHEIIDLIIQYREVKKIKNTYIDSMPNYVADDGRVHTNYDQTGTATGRLSSHDPNLQNIPIRTDLGQEFRKTFVAESGYKLVAFDYSQMELRIVAHIAKDKEMIETFKRGEDIHTKTASDIFDVSPEKVTPAMRRQAKVLNFGITYGMGPLGFSRASGVSRDRAREFIKLYFKEFSGVANYIEKIKESAHELGYVETIFGHRRLVPEIKSHIPPMKAAGERIAVNMPIQGSQADIIKLAMAEIHEYIASQSSDNTRMLLQIHDELLFEIKDDLVERVSPKIKQIMEKIYTLEVPLIVDVKAGSNWKETKPLII